MCFFQGSFVSETFSTMLADERPVSCVNCHMAFKDSFLIETVSTLLAGERLFSGVNSHVGTKSMFMWKTPFHTEGMYKVSLQCECSVPLKASFSIETIPHNFADKGLLSCVNPHVGFEVSLTIKILSTLLAGK